MVDFEKIRQQLKMLIYDTTSYKQNEKAWYVLNIYTWQEKVHLPFYRVYGAYRIYMDIENVAVFSDNSRMYNLVGENKCIS